MTYCRLNYIILFSGFAFGILQSCSIALYTASQKATDKLKTGPYPEKKMQVKLNTSFPYAWYYLRYINVLIAGQAVLMFRLNDLNKSIL